MFCSYTSQIYPSYLFPNTATDFLGTSGEWAEVKAMDEWSLIFFFLVDFAKDDDCDSIPNELWAQLVIKRMISDPVISCGAKTQEKMEKQNILSNLLLSCYDNGWYGLAG